MQSKCLIVLSLTDSSCDADPEHECIIGAVEVGSREEASAAVPKLKKQGFTTHIISTRPMEYYL